MTCETCGEAYELAIRDGDPVHECPEYDFGTILVVLTQPIRGRVGSTMENDPYQLDIDRETGRTALTARSKTIFKATYAVRVGDEVNLDAYTFEAREAIRQALDDALTSARGGKI